MLFTISFIFSIAIGVPIFAALGIPAAIELLRSPMPLVTLAQNLFTGVDQFPLLAIPCFILAGSLMIRGGITHEIITVMNILVGKLPGGLAVVTILSCMFFAAISGSGPGTTAAIGAIMIPAMVKKKYDIDFAGAVAASGGTLGVIIPPSNPMIVYGVLASVSVADLFIAGFLPGFLIGASMIVVSLFTCIRNGYRADDESFEIKRLVSAIAVGKYSLFMPFLILGGIYLGIFTPTEAAVVAVIYAFLVGLLVKKSLNLRLLWDSLSETSSICGGLVLIMGTAMFFGRFLSIEQVPQKIAANILSISRDPIVLMLIITAFLLFLGTFMETLSTVIILTPIFLPLLKAVGINPIHFGVIFVVTNEIGFLTPPLGVNLFVSCSLTGRTLEQISLKMIPFIVALCICLVILIYFPEVSLFLPRLLRG
jgi:C4-dicarboxylate transporter, DctM subunit